MDATQANEYINRINKVCDYIDRNLNKSMTLTELSGVAGFSQFHFHRIFAAMTGETLFSFIWRLRLERAASLLSQSGKGQNITQIAQSLGFSSSAVFSRKFKQHFNVSPTNYKNSNQSQEKSNLGQLLRNEGKALFSKQLYDEATLQGNNFGSFDMNPNVKIEKIDEMRVAYIRYVGPYAGDSELFGNLYARMGAWAGPRGIDMSTSYIIYHDDPNITDEQKLRLSVCVPIGEDARVSGEICEMKIDGGDYAVGTFLIASDEYGQAWSYMFAQWLPTSGYQPADSMPFERYSNNGHEDEGKMKVDICIPVKVV